ncbi:MULTISPECIES: hypothetical protein [Neisseria]|uniref:hypothetical protein n=1 Tax=Neisseria TaxID=482 RepID=UPI00265B6736|nr:MULTISPECIES: hypothetical protein [Neisseria]
MPSEDNRFQTASCFPNTTKHPHTGLLKINGHSEKLPYRLERTSENNRFLVYSKGVQTLPNQGNKGLHLVCGTAY